MISLIGWNRLRQRLVLAFVGMVLVSGGVLALFAGIQFRDFVLTEAVNNLTNTALSLASDLTETLEDGTSVGRSAAFQQFLETQANQIGASITLLDAGGNFVASSQTTESDLNPQAINTAQTNLIGTSRNQNTNNVETIYVAAPIVYENTRVAIIQLSRSTEHEWEQIRRQWTWLLLTVTSVTIAAFLLASWISATMIRPLNQLQTTVAHYAQGDLSTRFSGSSLHEIQTLGDNFNQMATELQSMIDEQRLFASNASHELRTPLASMKVRTELLVSGELDTETQQQYLVDVDEEVTRLGGLIEDLFLLSRIASDRLEAGQEQIDIRRLAGTVLSTLQPRIDQKNLQVTFITPDSLPNLQANTNHIRTVFRNILDNAIKYTPEGGSVRCEIVQHEDTVCIEVTDTGIGIQPDELAQITKHFYRSDTARYHKIIGHGLGMALVQSITSLYGGELHVWSEGDGKGTQVRVSFPQSPAMGTRATSGRGL